MVEGYRQTPSDIWHSCQHVSVVLLCSGKPHSSTHACQISHSAQFITFTDLVFINRNTHIGSLEHKANWSLSKLLWCHLVKPQSKLIHADINSATWNLNIDFPKMTDVWQTVIFFEHSTQWHSQYLSVISRKTGSVSPWLNFNVSPGTINTILSFRSCTIWSTGIFLGRFPEVHLSFWNKKSLQCLVLASLQYIIYSFIYVCIKRLCCSSKKNKWFFNVENDGYQ